MSRAALRRSENRKRAGTAGPPRAITSTRTYLRSRARSALAAKVVGGESTGWSSRGSQRESGFFSASSASIGHERSDTANRVQEFREVTR
jgi:hypothetical protein